MTAWKNIIYIARARLPRLSATELRAPREFHLRISFSAPPEFQGQAGQWTPEYLFLTSVAGCFLSTFSGMAHFSKFAFLSLDVEVEGALNKEE